MIALSLTSIAKRFGTSWALAHIDVEIPKGAVVLLTGENGAGKTTLLRVMATALKPTLGSLQLYGRDAFADLSQTRQVLALFTHTSHMYEALTASENLQIVARVLGKNADAVHGLLDRVGLRPHSHRSVTHFSAGMKRRLALARLLIKDPQVVFWDEPYASLDPEGVALMNETIQEHRQRGVTQVIATHDIERGLAICDHRMQLSMGRLKTSLESLR